MTDQNEQEEKIKVDGLEVNVKADNTKGLKRAKYDCKDCNMSFPSPLDLEAHQRVDHAKKVSAA